MTSFFKALAISALAIVPSNAACFSISIEPDPLIVGEDVVVRFVEEVSACAIPAPYGVFRVDRSTTIDLYFNSQDYCERIDLPRTVVDNAGVVDQNVKRLRLSSCSIGYGCFLILQRFVGSAIFLDGMEPSDDP